MLGHKRRALISGKSNRASSNPRHNSRLNGGGRMFKHSALVWAVAVMTLSAGTVGVSQDAPPAKPDAASAKQDKPSDDTKQEPPSTSVAPASVEISPNTLRSA